MSGSKYITPKFLEMARVRAALALLYPDNILPEFMDRSRYGQDHVDLTNWQLVADFMLEQTLKLVPVDDNTNYKDIPDYDDLMSLKRDTLLVYARENGLDTPAATHTKSDISTKLVALREARLATLAPTPEPVPTPSETS